jgi:two-component system sensor histidine kinase KdpD
MEGRVYVPEKARQAAELFIGSLYDFSCQLLDKNSLEQVLKNAGNAVSAAFNTEVHFLLPDNMGNLQLKARESPDGITSEPEWGIASWSFQQGKPAGRGTETLSSSKFRYIPLKRKGIVVGVMEIRLLDMEKQLRPDQVQLLDSFANIVAVAIARILRL